MRKIEKVGVLIVVALIVGLFSNPVIAQTDVCDGETGAARGLCIAATRGANCDQIEPSATTQACERLAQQYMNATGGTTAPWNVYDIGLEVNIYVNGILQLFTMPQLQSTTNATSLQDESGIVLLSTSLCDPSSYCSEFGAVRALLEGNFPIGTTVNYQLFAIKGLPNANADAHCRLDRLPTFATIPGTVMWIPSDSNLGDNIITLVADEPDGIVLHCEVGSHGLY